MNINNLKSKLFNIDASTYRCIIAQAVAVILYCSIKDSTDTCGDDNTATAFLWVPFLFKLAVMAAISYAIRPPKPKKPDTPTALKPANLAQFDIPTAEEGRPVQVLFGKRFITGPNVVGYKRLKVKAIWEITPKGNDNYIKGFKYHLDMHMVLGHAYMDAVERIKVGESLVWTYDWFQSKYHTESLILTDEEIDDFSGVFGNIKRIFAESRLIAQITRAITTTFRAIYPADVVKGGNTGPASKAATSQGAADIPYWLAQTFTTTSSYTITSVGLVIYRSAGSAGILGDITISIKATDDDGHPTGDDLCFATLDASVFPDVNGDYLSWTIIQFDNPFMLAGSTKYAIVVRLEQNIAGRQFGWRRDITDLYAGGNLETSIDAGTTWTADILYPTYGDCLFKTYSRRGYAPNHTIRVTASNVFGGIEKGGGISGNINLLFGKTNQTQNSRLASDFGSDTPAYRGLTSVVLDTMYLGTSPSLAPWSFLCKRIAKQISGDAQWYTSKAVIRPRTDAGDDLNPVHIIRECMIDTEIGIGWDADSDIDDTSFRTAADTLYDEQFGLSLIWDQTQQLDEFIGGILNCIAGFLYQDLETGKWILELTRESTTSVPIISNEDAVVGGTIYPKWILANYALFPVEKYHSAQTFTATKTFETDSIQLKISTSSDITVRVELQGVTDDVYYGTIYKVPDNIPLVYGAITNEDIPITKGWVTINFNKKHTLIKDQQYAIVFYITAASPESYLYFDYDLWQYSANLSNVKGGCYCQSSNYGGQWGAYGTYDMFFKVLGADVDTYNEDNIIAMEDFVRPSYGEITNVVVVNWWDKLANKSRPAQAKDIALISKQGGKIIDLILNMYGICNATLATKVAERELKLNSSMLASLRIKANRTMSHLKPNDIFKLSWDELDITNMLVRIIDANYGSLLKNEVYFNCIEVQGTSDEVVTGDSPDDEGTDLVTDPIAVVAAILIEAPYWVMCNDFADKSVIDGYGSTAGYLMIAAVSPVDDAYDFSYLTRISAPFEYADAEAIAGWCPSATIVSDIYMESDDITIDIADITDVDGIITNKNETANETTYALENDGGYAIIGNEIIKVLTFNSDTDQIEITRGVLDSVPEAHSAGDRIYFIGSNYTAIPEMYSDGDTPDVKLLPRTANGKLSADDATVISADALDSRIIRPYVPGNLKFNSESFPTFLSSKAASKFTITWNHRDRTNVTQLQSIVEHSTAVDYGPEAGATYTIKVYDEDNVLRRTVTGLSTKTYDYTNAFEISDCGSLQSQLRFVIYSVRAGFDSFQSYDVLIKRSFEATSTPAATLSGSLHVETPMSSTSLVAVSGADATMHLPDLFGFSFDTTAALTGYIEIQRDLIAASAAALLIVGALDTNQNLISTAAGTSAITGPLDINQNLVSVVVGVSAVTGSMT